MRNLIISIVIFFLSSFCLAVQEVPIEEKNLIDTKEKEIAKEFSTLWDKNKIEITTKKIYNPNTKKFEQSKKSKAEIKKDYVNSKLFEWRCEKLINDNKRINNLKYNDLNKLFRFHKIQEIKTYSKAKRLKGIYPVVYLKERELPIDASYTYGHFKGEKQYVVKVYLSNGQIKKYKPNMSNLYWDDIIRAINDEIIRAKKEIILAKRRKIKTEDILKYIKKMEYEQVKEKYYKHFLENKYIKLKLISLNIVLGEKDED